MFTKSSGISLIELMIALVVVSILVGISYPGYQKQIRENRRSDGQKMLLQTMHAQQMFYSNNSNFTADLITDLGLLDAGGGAVASDKGFYVVSTGVCDAPTPIEDCVLLTATPQTVQVSDGPLTYNSRNVKTPASHW